MRVLVTGAHGFVGRWLVPELGSRGYEVVTAPAKTELDITDRDAVGRLVGELRPSAVIHLAAVAFGGAVTADPRRALRTNIEGTLNVLEACERLDRDVVALVVSSSEVYAASGSPEPLSESSPPGPRSLYGCTKLAAEGVAAHVAARGMRVAIVRAFNHTGAGQQPPFVVPSLAARVLAARAEGRRSIPVGNMHVRRDIGDVRDTVRAYALLLELLTRRDPADGPLVVNVATGVATQLSAIASLLAELACWEVELTIDPRLVRVDDPEVIVGDASRLAALTGWAPMRSLDETLSDVLGSVGAR